MNVLAIGASRNIGYYSSLRLLAAECTVTFMLRSPSVFDSDEAIQSHIKSGKAHLSKGDALVQSDMKRAWDEASTHGNVDLLLFTVGATQASFNLFKGFVISPANLVTQALLNILCTMPTQDSPPKSIIISSAGFNHSSYAALPLLMKPLYAYLLKGPLKDKMGAERAIAHCTGWNWDTEHDGEPSDEIMGQGWTERKGLPAKGTLKNVLVIRPVMLTDGECKAEKKENTAGYRVKAGDIAGGWTVSRKDVAHFVANAALNRWDEFSDKCISIAY
ncbi:hypothetical protein BDP27DRAFT_1338890 [Rhodocollybia butyracea]|uniref:NAD(P)-binding domain-containing protein n=1 Tax=Rhodocollybia butyracea TaxID=206335 RepID=A0A9P5PDY4_9AGAR|nr:hypothetical protein BDP27DRAFT_1338890 [Rhodocollybia butyracea]